MSIEMQNVGAVENGGRPARGSGSEDDDARTPKGLGTSPVADRKDAGNADMQMEPSAEDVKKTMAAGTVFVKHAHGKALSDKRIVWYHESGGKGFIAWQPVANTLSFDPKRSIPLSSIREIFLGKQSSAFLRRHATNVNDEYCFSLMSEEPKKRTLDLEADSRRARDAWLKNLKILLNAADITWKLHASPASKDADEKEIMEKRGVPVKFQVHVRCKNLPRRLDAAELDSVCVGFEKLEATGRLIYLAQTDQIRENDSPAYGSPLILPYYAGAKQMLKIAVYAVEGDTLPEEQQIGFAQMPFSTLVDGPGLGEELTFQLKSNDAAKDKKLKDMKSTMFVTCTPALLSEAELLAKMQRIFMAGDSFYLYHSKHPASRVLVFFRKATHDKGDMIYWCRDNTVDKNGKDTKEKPRCVEFGDCCMPLLSITDIYLGRQTAAFERPPANKAPSDRCFSFKSNYQGRVLDLQAKSPQVRDAWVFGLMALIRQMQNITRQKNVSAQIPRLQLHNEPPPPRRTPIPHSHNFKCTLAISARNLPEAVDPLVGVFLRNSGTGKLKFVDHTETMMDKSNPVYTKRIVVDYGDPQGASHDVRFTVYNVETPQIREKDTLGFASCSVTTLLDSYGKEVILPLNNPRNKSLNRTLSERKAVVVVKNIQAVPSGTLEIKISCRGMSSLDGTAMGSKHWCLVAYESMPAAEKDEKADKKAAASAKSGKQSSIPVKYFGQTECVRDSGNMAADFRTPIGPLEYRGGDNKIIKLAVFVCKDEAASAGIKDFSEKQQESDRLCVGYLNLDNMMISGEATTQVKFSNPENRGRDLRLRADDAHCFLTYTFKPHNPPPSAVPPPSPGALSGVTGDSKWPSGNTVTAAELKLALASQSNQFGTINVPSILKKLITKMVAGRSFIQYVDGQPPAKIQLTYREDGKTAGFLNWTVVGGTAPPQSLALDTVQHVYLGKQFPALANAPATGDICLSVCSPNYALHLQCNNAKTRDQWSYGLMGVLQQAGSMAKLHQESAAANSTANGTPASAEKKKATLLKAQAAASKGSEMAIALGLPALPLPTQKMMGLMFQGKKFIRYPFTAAQNGATLSKVFYRAAMNKLGTLYYAEATAGDNPDLNALTAAGAALPVHLITDIIVGNSSHPSAPVGCAVNAANCLSFIASSTGQSLHLEAKDTKQAVAWGKTIESLLQTGGQTVNFVQPAANASPNTTLTSAVTPLSAITPLAAITPLEPIAAIQPLTFTPIQPIAPLSVPASYATPSVLAAAPTSWQPPPPPQPAS